MRRESVWGIFLGLAVLMGCSKGVSVAPTAPKASFDSVKTALQAIAATGEFGSDVEGIEQDLEKLKATDAAKAEGLLKDLQSLKTAQQKSQIQAKAKEMLGKL